MFLAALAEVETLIQVYGFIRLQEHGPSRHIRTALVEKAGAFNLHYFASCPFGATAYAITPRVAAAFIERSSVLERTRRRFHQKVLGARPTAVLAVAGSDQK